MKIRLIIIFQLAVFIISCEGKPSEWNIIEENHTDPVGEINGWISGPVIEVNLDKTNEAPQVIKGTKKSPFTVSEAQKNLGLKGVWIEGYIVGGFTGSKIGSFTQDPNVARKSNIAIANQQNETNANAIFPVELPAGKIRNSINIFDNPTNMGKKITIRGNIERYFSVPGLKKPKDFLF